jgi:hypothetical protein
VSNKPQMVPGFNHNIKHNKQIFHIQTEDSGALNPHIITHLFVGGNILATKKTSYADIVHADNLLQIVKELMQEQHKAMLRNLINGVYDNIAARPGGAPVDLNETEPQPVSAPPAARAQKQAEPLSLPVAQAPAQAAQAPTSTLPPPPGKPLPAPPVTLTPKQPAAEPAVVVAQDQFPAAEPTVVVAQDQFPAAEPVQSTPPPVAKKPPAEPKTSAAASAGGFSRPVTGTKIHRPPAPEKVPTTSTGQGAARVTLRPKQTEQPTQPPVAKQVPAEPSVVVEQAPAVSPPVEAQPTAAQAVQAQAASDEPLPPEVLAAQRLAEKPKPKDTSGPTIFGESLISEKSLDEVILGYLAGNEDGP